jgi:hypothetical protein
MDGYGSLKIPDAESFIEMVLSPELGVLTLRNEML